MSKSWTVERNQISSKQSSMPSVHEYVNSMPGQCYYLCHSGGRNVCHTGQAPEFICFHDRQEPDDVNVVTKTVKDGSRE